MKNSATTVRLAVGIFALLLALNIGLANAEELKGMPGSINALNTGYAITRWPYTDGDIYVGQDATVRACTTIPPPPDGSGPTQVVFRWHRPDDSYFDIGPIDLALSDDTWEGKPIYDAYDTQTLNILDSWGVQALFLGEGGTLQGPEAPYDIVKIKAISWHVLPEVPLGAIVTVLSMAGALSVFAIRKKVLAKR